MPGRALLAALIAIAVLAVPAAADTATTPGFVIGRVVHGYPDAHGRIGIRSICQQPAGCTVELRIERAGSNPPVIYGRVFVLLISGTTETDYVILSKSSRALLAKKGSIKATVEALVKDPSGAMVSYKKPFTLKAPPKKR